MLNLVEKIADATGLTVSIKSAVGNLEFWDHLIDQMSPVPAMAAVAAISDRLRIGAFVLNNDLRHPARGRR